ncbi:unnamed protein product [Lupinus luteus]|uniref:Uncharacterized protein n=1 Tax=Lupinus luteus TaxID=3873 RepID=A0AAV1X1K4_LUPLU
MGSTTSMKVVDGKCDFHLGVVDQKCDFMVGGNRGYHPRLPCECRGPHSRHPLSINSKPEDPPTEEYRR